MGVMHERVASPLMCTVQAPHKAIPQPNFVPVMFKVSRRTHKSGICGSTSTVVDLPFSVKVTAMATSVGLGKHILQQVRLGWKYSARAEKQRQAAILARAGRGLPQILLTCYYAAGIRTGSLPFSFAVLVATVESTRNLILSLFPAQDQGHASLRGLTDRAEAFTRA